MEEHTMLQQEMSQECVYNFNETLNILYCDDTILESNIVYYEHSE